MMAEQDELITAIDDLRDAVCAMAAQVWGEELDFEVSSADPVEAINEITNALKELS